jgi:hypothetical protein
MAAACDNGLTSGTDSSDTGPEPGTYLIPVVAWKETADEPSMMASLVYPGAFVEIGETGIYATFYFVKTTIMGIPVLPSSVGGIQYNDDGTGLKDALFEEFDPVTVVRTMKIKLADLETAIPIHFTQSDYGTDIRLKFSPGLAEPSASPPVFEPVVIDVTEFSLTWKMSFGGDQLDYPQAIAALADGSLVAAGYSRSNTGDFQGLNKGGYDGFIAKISPLGALTALTNFSCSGGDYAYSVLAASDGGFLVAGDFTNADGDFEGVEKTGTDSDAYIAKFNAAGTLQWIKTYGGTGEDSIYYIIPSRDGGYILTGTTSSTDGDFAEAGTTDSLGDNIFIMKLDASFNVQWARSMGGTGTVLHTVSYSTVELSDGSIIAGGHTNAKNGTFEGVGHNGTYNIFLVKYDANGTRLWVKKYYGDGNGSTKNSYVESITTLSDGNILLLGSTNMNTDVFDGFSPTGRENAVILKLSQNGDVLFARSIQGGLTDDDPPVPESKTTRAVFAKKMPGGGFTVFGHSQAERGVFAGENRGGYDLFVAGYDEDGTLQGIANIGGTDVDYTTGVVETGRGYAILAQSRSKDIDFDGLNGAGSYDSTVLLFDQE